MGNENNENITFICACCNSDERVKMRTHNGIEEGTFCLPCWNSYKKDIGKVFICEDCGSNKNVKHRTISTGSDKNDYLGGVLCKSCFLDLFYEYSN